jgi:hypothetical protein
MWFFLSALAEVYTNFPGRVVSFMLAQRGVSRKGVLTIGEEGMPCTLVYVNMVVHRNAAPIPLARSASQVFRKQGRLLKSPPRGDFLLL